MLSKWLGIAVVIAVAFALASSASSFVVLGLRVQAFGDRSLECSVCAALTDFYSYLHGAMGAGGYSLVTLGHIEVNVMWLSQLRCLSTSPALRVQVPNNHISLGFRV